MGNLVGEVVKSASMGIRDSMPCLETVSLGGAPLTRVALISQTQVSPPSLRLAREAGRQCTAVSVCR